MGPVEHLKVTTSADGAALVAEGQIDAHTSQALDDALSAVAADAEVDLDLAEVSFIDSSGLRVIVRIHKRQLEHGGGLTIVAPSEAVTRLLDITGLTSQLRIRPTA